MSKAQRDNQPLVAIRWWLLLALSNALLATVCASTSQAGRGVRESHKAVVALELLATITEVTVPRIDAWFARAASLTNGSSADVRRQVESLGRDVPALVSQLDRWKNSARALESAGKEFPWEWPLEIDKCENDRLVAKWQADRQSIRVEQTKLETLAPPIMKAGTNLLRVAHDIGPIRLPVVNPKNLVATQKRISKLADAWAPLASGLLELAREARVCAALVSGITETVEEVERHNAAVAQTLRAMELSDVSALQSPNAAEAHLRRARMKFDRRDLHGARSDCTQSLELSPDWTRALFVRAEIEFLSRDLDATIADLSRVLKLLTNSASGYASGADWGWARRRLASAYGLRADSELAQNNFAGALADSNRSIELTTNGFWASCQRVQIYATSGQLDQALQACDALLELWPRSAGAYRLRGRTRISSGDVAGDMADFDQALKLAPRDARTFTSRGMANYNLRSWANALADFRKASALPSDYSDYSAFRVWLIRARSGDSAGATRELQRHMRSHRVGNAAPWSLAIASFLSGQMSEQEFFAAAVSPLKQKDSEQHCEAWFYAGSKHLFVGDSVTAKAYFEKCRATNVRLFTEYDSAAAELKFLEREEAKRK